MSTSVSEAAPPGASPLPLAFHHAGRAIPAARGAAPGRGPHAGPARAAEPEEPDEGPAEPADEPPGA